MFATTASFSRSSLSTCYKVVAAFVARCRLACDEERLRASLGLTTDAIDCLGSLLQGCVYRDQFFMDPGEVFVFSQPVDHDLHEVEMCLGCLDRMHQVRKPSDGFGMGHAVGPPLVAH